MEGTNMKTRLHLTGQRMAATCLGLLLLTSCGAAAPSSNLQQREAPAATPAIANQPAFAPAEKGTGNTVADATGSAQVTARLIVRNANMTLIVQDTQARLDTISGLAKEFGGYVASSSTTKFEQGLQARVTLRIPAEKFDTALDRLRKLAVEVREEQVSGDDVTAEYTDLGSRQRNLEAAEAQLREILSKAEKTEDVLSIFNRLTEIRGEIEQVKGRMQFLSQSAALSTINLTLIPDVLAQPVQVAGWRPEGVIKTAVETLISALQTLASIAIWLIIVVLPVALIVSSPFILLIVILRRRNKRKPTTATPPLPSGPPAETTKP
jgi:hypothetical protein